MRAEEPCGYPEQPAPPDPRDQQVSGFKCNATEQQRENSNARGTPRSSAKAHVRACDEIVDAEQNGNGAGCYSRVIPS